MEPARTVEQLRHLISERDWTAVAAQMDLLHVASVARGLSGLDCIVLSEAFSLLPYQRRSAVFAHLPRSDQDALLNAVGPERARRIVRGLLPEDRRALLRAMPGQTARAIRAMTATSSSQGQAAS